MSQRNRSTTDTHKDTERVGRVRERLRERERERERERRMWHNGYLLRKWK